MSNFYTVKSIVLLIRKWWLIHAFAMSLNQMYSYLYYMLIICNNYMLRPFRIDFWKVCLLRVVSYMYVLFRILIFIRGTWPNPLWPKKHTNVSKKHDKDRTKNDKHIVLDSNVCDVWFGFVLILPKKRLGY